MSDDDDARAALARHETALLAASSESSKPSPTKTVQPSSSNVSLGIFSAEDVESFLASSTGRALLGFVAALSEASSRAPRIPMDHEVPFEDVVYETVMKETTQQPSSLILQALCSARDVLRDAPPEDGEASRQRFGNKAFRVWHGKLTTQAEAWAKAIFPSSEEVNLRSEFIVHWTKCWGDPTRIDFGTGHEVVFAVLCLILVRTGKETSMRRLVSRVFPLYFETARKIRSVYRLEPAGSHGVWSLDDYQYLPFVLGSAEMTAHADGLTPKDVFRTVNTSVYPSSTYSVLIAAVREISTSKSGPFNEHSPMLHELSGMRSWSEINQGLLRMWRGEVLGKFPVAQHFWFGPSFPIVWEPSTAVTADSGIKHSILASGGPPLAAFDPLQKYFHRGHPQAAQAGAPSAGSDVSYVMLADGIELPQYGWKIQAKSDAGMSSESQLAELTKLDFPLPEMVFHQNWFQCSHERLVFRVEAAEALEGVKLADPAQPDRKMIKVSMAEKWMGKKDSDGNDIREWRNDYDWTFTTKYGGTWLPASGLKPTPRRIDYELLKRRDPILWSKEVILYEDDLLDMGVAKLSVKVRVMPTCFFVLIRFFLRVDRTYFRAFDTRVFHAFGTKHVLVEQSEREGPYVAALHEKMAADDASVPLVVETLPVTKEPVTREIDLTGGASKRRGPGGGS